MFGVQSEWKNISAKVKVKVIGFFSSLIFKEENEEIKITQDYFHRLVKVLRAVQHKKLVEEIIKVDAKTKVLAKIKDGFVELYSPRGVLSMNIECVEKLSIEIINVLSSQPENKNTVLINNFVILAANSIDYEREKLLFRMIQDSEDCYLNKIITIVLESASINMDVKESKKILFDCLSIIRLLLFSAKCKMSA